VSTLANSQSFLCVHKIYRITRPIVANSAIPFDHVNNMVARHPTLWTGNA
jgi:hypothetical protein